MFSKRVFIWSVCGICVCLSVLGFLYARPMYRLYKDLKATYIIKKAQTSITQEDYNQAWLKAQKAYTLAPHNVLVNRTIANIYEKVDAKQALIFWLETVKLTNNPEDRKDLIQVALTANNLNIVREQLDILESNNIEDGETLFLKAEYSYKQNNIHQALIHIKKCLEYPNPPEKAPILYAILSLESNDIHQQQAGIDYLKKLALVEKPTPLSLQSLRLLAQIPFVKTKDLQQIALQFDQYTDLKNEDRLLSIALKYKSQLITDQEAIKQAITFFDLNQITQKITFLQWLNKQGLYTYTTQYLSLQESLTRQDLFLIWIDAMAVQKQWSALEKILSPTATTILPIEEYLAWIFRARIYTELKQSQKSNLAWSKALLSLQNSPQKMWGLLDYSIQLNDIPKIRITFEKLTTIPSFSLKAYEQWASWEKQQGNIQQVINLFEKMYSLFPNNSNIHNDLIYLQLLLNKNIESNTQKARELVNKEPSYLAHRMTLALGLYKSNRLSEALETIINLSIDWNSVDPSYRVVAAAILEDNGQVNDAIQLLKTTPLENTLREERSLVSSYIFDLCEQTKDSQ